jgi:hypothetical protein
MAPLRTETLTARTLVVTGLTIAGFLLLILYIVWQARFLLIGPVVTLTEEPPRVQNERAVTITGEVRNITSLTLNGRPIFTDPSGTFRESLVLENGYTIATIAAFDRYGRETKLERAFVYRPASLATP